MANPHAPRSRHDTAMSDSNESPRVPKASDVLVLSLRARILGEGMQPGDALPSEAELIESYQMSRGTVREALRLLETDGLISIKRGPGGGVRVRHPDLSQVSRSLALLFTADRTTLADFLAFRMLVEPEAAAEAARSATPEQQQWLLELGSQPCEASPSLDWAPRFHGAIGECSNNGVYQVILGAMHRVLEWHVFTEALSASDIERTGDAHRALAEAISRRDAERAAKIMRRHLESFEAAVAKLGRLHEPVIAPDSWRTRA